MLLPGLAQSHLALHRDLRREDAEESLGNHVGHLGAENLHPENVFIDQLVLLKAVEALDEVDFFVRRKPRADIFDDNSSRKSYGLELLGLFLGVLVGHQELIDVPEVLLVCCLRMQPV